MSTLNVYEWGEPEAPAVVCLHGVTSYGGRFDSLADRLADRSTSSLPTCSATGARTGSRRGTWTRTSPRSSRSHRPVRPPGSGTVSAGVSSRSSPPARRSASSGSSCSTPPSRSSRTSRTTWPSSNARTPRTPASQQAVQARYDAGRVLLAPRDLRRGVRRSAHGARRRRPAPLPLLQEHGGRGLEHHGEPIAGSGSVADPDGAGRRLVADERRPRGRVPGGARRPVRARHGPRRPHRVLGRARRDGRRPRPFLP